MKYTAEFILGLIGSILGFIFAIIWLFMGTGFWAHFIFGFQGGWYMDDSLFVVGFFIAAFQSIVLIGIYICSVIFSIPSNIEKNQKRSSIILIVGGSVALIINIASLIPSVLILISGILLTRKRPPEQADV
ncbi:hypothetical protein [Evansella cellulosilytica]|uniref:DUF4064 domain-containing protein n=1 Tax=Evansella cellulosilytica (strain ATCC 21833 / DSM 2522 / FERM P-1141 / JCM 9156 / N-4) TaxID=649639 RepID=E6TTY7_EVAC2|nr:hypothetical protein [Evansella cellulosilytica]ADU32018.1 hypothetical protein Bcell_3778 [Evansella cellulosilytica DSM 2522]